MAGTPEYTPTTEAISQMILSFPIGQDHLMYISDMYRQGTGGKNLALLLLKQEHHILNTDQNGILSVVRKLYF